MSTRNAKKTVPSKKAAPAKVSNERRQRRSRQSTGRTNAPRNSGGQSPAKRGANVKAKAMPAPVLVGWWLVWGLNEPNAARAFAAR
jgi:hypothetical protein